MTSIIRVGTAYLTASQYVAPPAVCFYRPGLSLVFHVRRTSAHRSLVSLHCWATERVQFKLATLMFRGASVALLTQLVLLSTSFHRVADVPSRRRPRSSSTDALIVRPTTNSYRRRSYVSGFSCQSFEQTSRQCFGVRGQKLVVARGNAMCTFY